MHVIINIFEFLNIIFDNQKIIEDQIGNVKLQLEKLDSGEIKVTNLETQEEIIPIRLFWFAWAAFHPDTQLYSN